MRLSPRAKDHGTWRRAPPRDKIGRGRKTMSVGALASNGSGLQQKLLWAAVIALGAVSFAIIALSRGESVNAAWLVIAAICIYFIAYRFYATFTAKKVLQVDAARPTPAYRHNDGLDYVPTDRYDLRPSFRSDCRCRSTGWSRTFGAAGN